jgi:hypothetical protein
LVHGKEVKIFKNVIKTERWQLSPLGSVEGNGLDGTWITVNPNNVSILGTNVKVESDGSVKGYGRFCWLGNLGDELRRVNVKVGELSNLKLGSR